MLAYYNEFDRKTAAWLRELIKEGHIADGIVDERSVCDVQPGDLDGFTQCHFFAGIGGWSCALRLVGWEDSWPAWTASLPCQPFASGGKRGGQLDSRHLWPYFYRLVKKRKPGVIFGEQVERAIGFRWFDRVCADLEEEAYSIGSVVLGAHSVGAPHVRQRLYWVSVSDDWCQRISRDIPKEICRESPFSWCKNGGRVEDLRGRPDIPEPLVRSLRHGFPDGMASLHGYGNAIVPQVAAEFIQAFVESCHDIPP